MASAYWYTLRLWAIDTGMMNDEIAATSSEDENMKRFTAAFSTLAVKPAYRLLNIYEGRLHRRYHRAIHTMLALHQARHRMEIHNAESPGERPEKDGQTNPV